MARGQSLPCPALSGPLVPEIRGLAAPWVMGRAQGRSAAGCGVGGLPSVPGPSVPQGFWGAQHVWPVCSVLTAPAGRPELRVGPGFR